jgi:hypothetical protein
VAAGRGQPGDDERRGSHAAQGGDGTLANGPLERFGTGAGEGEFHDVRRRLVAAVEELERDRAPEVTRAEDLLELSWFGRLTEVPFHRPEVPPRRPAELAGEEEFLEIADRTLLVGHRSPFPPPDPSCVGNAP